MHTPSLIVAEEAEEIGVEHLLRDIRDAAVGTLATRVTAQLQSLQGLHLRLRDIGIYLGRVAASELPVNHAVLGHLQDIFNLLPGLSTPGPGAAAGGKTTDEGIGAGAAAAARSNELARAMSVKTNDQLMSIYVSSLIRAITAFHDLIENKVQNRQQAEERGAGTTADKADGEVKAVNGDKQLPVADSETKKADSGTKKADEEKENSKN